MIYAVQHRSSYTYQETVDLSDHLLHLTPRHLPWQRVIETSLRTEPATPSIAHGVDYFGNAISFLSLPPWESVRDALDGGGFPADVAAAEFAGDSPLAPAGPEFAAYAAPSFPSGRPLLEAVLDLTRRIHREFTFDPQATELTTPLAEIIETQRGVCQDFAHAEIAALRSLGLAARYISGYIRTYPAPGRPRLAGADASHAWASVYCPAIGWIDVDPTNNLVVGEEHIVLAWGRDYGDVSPVRGVILGSGEHSLAVSVDVAAER